MRLKLVAGARKVHVIRRYQPGVVPKTDFFRRTHNGVEIPDAAVQPFGFAADGFGANHSVWVRLARQFVVAGCGE